MLRVVEFVSVQVTWHLSYSLGTCSVSLLSSLLYRCEGAGAVLLVSAHMVCAILLYGRC